MLRLRADISGMFTGVATMSALAIALAAPVAVSASAPPATAIAAEPGTAQQAAFDALARDMGLVYTIVDNQPAKCPTGPSCFVTTIDLTMPATLPPALEGRNFALYFSFVNPMQRVDSDIFQHLRMTGDVNRLTLKPGATLTPGARYRITLWGEGKHHSMAFPMPNMYIVADGVQARTIAATRPRIDADTGLETLPFVTPMTDPRLAAGAPEDKTVWQTPQAAFAAFAERGPATDPTIAIVPTPHEARLTGGPAIDLRQGVSLKLSGLATGDIAAALDDLLRIGVRVGNGPELSITRDATAGLAPEAYRLTATGNAIRIVAADAAGVGHALQSLVQQAAFDRLQLRPITISDAPRYPFRALHLDVARNFHSKAQILKLIRAMDSYKFNALHLHLADDEGWRLEIKALPELTEVGSRRCHDLSEQTCLLPQLGAGPDGISAVNGFLTQADYIDIVRAAHARQIEIMPSLDMPGHSRAAIRSMEVRYNRLMKAGKRAEAEAYRLVEPGDTTKYVSIQNYNDNTLNVCIDQTYRFLNTAVDEIAALHRAAGAPLKTFHIGADETAGAWSQSPSCQPLMAATGRPAKGLTGIFIERVARDLAAKGIKAAGWSDGMGHTDPAKMPAKVQTNIWATLFTGAVGEAHGQANLGWDVILSVPDFAYLDMPYVARADEGGYDWASRSVDTLQVFGFMPDNLPANGALIRDTFNRPQTIEDKTPMQAGRGFRGVEAQMWSETIRTDQGIDYLYFPRLLALSERAWRRAPWEVAYKPGEHYAYGDRRVDRAAILADWRGFAGRMPTQMALLDTLGVKYRLTPPGARIVDGRLEANAEYPGLEIEYRVAGGIWQPYRGPVAVTGAVDLRTRTSGNVRASRTVTVQP